MTLYGNELLTPRLRLRRVLLRDIPMLAAWSGSEIAHGEYLTPHAMDEETGYAQLESGLLWGKKSRTFIIEIKGGTSIGSIQYWLRRERRECAVMALKISVPGARKKGYGTEAQKYLIINLFERLEIDEIQMYTDINNVAQLRCLAKLGFEQVESLTYDDHRVTRLGYLFRLCRSQYQQSSVYKYYYE
ncbi:MAG: GNAT family N-acetyltransferase [Desulfobacteraceae bacterium]|nr:GNAT family N-acetyltransferase [Desulfobacteraceae bacterium]